MSAIYDVFTHPSGAALEDSVAEAVKVFRQRRQCEPAAVWLNPTLPAVAVEGLEVKRGRHMSPWYVYLEMPSTLPLFAEDVCVQTQADELVDELIVDEPVELRQLALF